MRHSHADETDTAVQESKGRMSIFVVRCCLTASGTSCVSSWMSGLYEVECRGKHLRCVGKHHFFSRSLSLPCCMNMMSCLYSQGRHLLRSRTIDLINCCSRSFNGAARTNFLHSIGVAKVQPDFHVFREEMRTRTFVLCVKFLFQL